MFRIDLLSITFASSVKVSDVTVADEWTDLTSFPTSLYEGKISRDDLVC